MPCLAGIATAVPEIRIAQDDVVDAARGIFGGRLEGFNRLSQVFTSAGIATRHLARPLDWYLRPQGWQARNAAYLTVAPDLFYAAAIRALERSGHRPDQVDTVITVSSTGIATPSLEALAADRIGFRRDIIRIPVFGWGCAGGAAGLGLAADLAARRAGSVVLLVAVELCSLSFRLDVLSKENIVATALFGDGAAAAVITSEGAGIPMHAGRQLRWPDTLGIMGWNVDDAGLGVVFDRSIPPFAEAHLPDAVRTLWPETADAPPAGYVCHPGGAKVITALETALCLTTGTLAAERKVLSRFGNMSAPTVLFVLEEAMQSGRLDDALLLALGPGFSLAGLRLGAGANHAR